jgi:cell division protein FtsI/penicillin-binding protein 2
MTQQRARETRRVWLPAAFFAAFALVILGRLIELQVIDHERYAQAAKNELLGSDTVYARRGSILDRNGNALAESVDTWDIYINSRSWKDDSTANAASEALAKAMRLNAAELRGRVRQSKSVDVLIGRDVDYEVGKNHPRWHRGRGGPPEHGARQSRRRPWRFHLGFIGQDNSGLAGIEAAYNDTLQGKPARRSTNATATRANPSASTSCNPRQQGPRAHHRPIHQLRRNAARPGDQGPQSPGRCDRGRDPDRRNPGAGDDPPGTARSTRRPARWSCPQPGRPDLSNPQRHEVITAASAIDHGVVSPDTTYVNSAWSTSTKPTSELGFPDVRHQTMTASCRATSTPAPSSRSKSLPPPSSAT